ncbi:DUF5994 family protein [Streptomyces sp. NPDC005708]|uniref:DUF5994 family protein n=1 Tax=Streptomyces sp. NPDC005708 TaxID=3154564 RepID=UPI0033F9F0FD
MVGSLDPGFGTVTRVTVDTAAWPAAPRTVMTPGHAIEVALTDVDFEAHAIVLDVGTVHRWQLRVIPPVQPLGTATLAAGCRHRPRDPPDSPANVGSRRGRVQRRSRREARRATGNRVKDLLSASDQLRAVHHHHRMPLRPE